MGHEASRRKHVFQELHGFLQEPQFLFPLSSLRLAQMFFSGWVDWPVEIARILLQPVESAVVGVEKTMVTSLGV
jgi:hypothetical protein